MDQGPLVSEETEAGADLVREFNNYAPVDVAFWLKQSDDDFRYLYIASKGIEANNLHLAYKEMLRLANKIQSPYLDPFRVKLIDSENPLAKAALEIRRHYPGPMATRLGGGRPFGGISIADGYIYPSPIPSTQPLAP
jgi:hypothetical protein